VSTTEELLERNSGLEIREYGRRDPSRWSCDILYSQKLVLTSPTSGCRSVRIVRSRTRATEFSLYKWVPMYIYSYISVSSKILIRPRFNDCQPWLQTLHIQPQDLTD
jgi:hypothetical protein